MPTKAEYEQHKAQIEERLRRMREAAEQMPAGPRRDLALLEYECSAGIVDFLKEELPTDSTLHEERMKVLRGQIATLYYAGKAKGQENPPTPGELREKGAKTATDPIFASIIPHTSGYDNSDYALHYLFGGKSMRHAGGWIEELENGRVDYKRDFETFAKDVPAEKKDALRTRYLDMALVNEAAKGQDYGHGKTPEELFKLASSPELEERHRRAIRIGETSNRNTERIKSLSKIRAQIPFPGDVPSGLERMYFYFLDPAETSDAAHKNQEIVNKLHSEDPGTAAFKKQFTLDVINRMLSVDDEKLIPKNSEEAAKLFESDDYYVVQSLIEVPNFLNKLQKRYDMPENVVNALRHKSRLAQTFITPYNQKFAVEASDQYAIIAMTDDWDAEFTGTVGVSENRVAKLTSAQSLAIANAGIGKGQDLMKEENDVARPGNNGLHLTSGEMRPIGFTEDFEPRENAPQEPVEKPEKQMPDLGPEPVPPRKPGGLKPLLHGWFGWFQKDFDRYKAQRNRYDRLMEERRAAIANADSPLQKAADDKRKNWRNLQQSRIGNSLDAARERVDGIASGLKTRLDGTFSAIEERSAGRVSRLDYVMIGCKTLRAQLTEEFMALNPDADPTSKNSAQLNEFLQSSLKNGHAERMMIRAEYNKIPIRVFSPDPVTGRLPAGDDLRAFAFGIPEIAHVGDGLGPLDTESVSSYINGATNLDLGSPSDPRARMFRANDTFAAIRDLNYVHRCALSNEASRNLNEQFFGDQMRADPAFKTKLQAKTDLSVDRTALTTHTVAYLLTEKNMTPEQIRDPAFDPQTKKDAGKYVVSLIEDSNGCRYDELAKINVGGIRKINEYVNDRMKTVDLTRDDQLFSEQNECVFSFAHMGSDLAQELVKKQKLNKEAENVVGGKKALDELIDTTDVPGLGLSAILSGREAESEMLLGNVADANVKRAHLLSGEITRATLQENRRPGVPFTQAVTPLQIVGMTGSGAMFKPDPLEEDENKIAMADRLTVKTPDDVRELASYAHSGALRKECSLHEAEPNRYELSYHPVTENAARESRPSDPQEVLSRNSLAK